MTHAHQPAEVSMTTRPKSPPRPPSLNAARKLALDTWLNPTEDGLREARRALVRRMWQARRAGRPDLRAKLRVLYDRVCDAQRTQDWQADHHERASRDRNRNNPGQYAREQAQRQGGVSALLTLHRPGPLYTPPSPPARKPLGRTRTRFIHDHFTGKSRRDRERHARNYAESYYQALRNWATHPIDTIELPRREPGSSSDGRMQPVVGNWASKPRHIVTRLLILPWRDQPEGHISTLCEQDPTLSIIRDGHRRCLSTLVDERGGWHPKKKTAVEYAHAVLTLAYHLGDPHAHEHLRNLPLAEIQPEP